MKKQTIEQDGCFTIIHTFEDKEYTPEELMEAKEKIALQIYKAVYNKY